MSDNSNNSCFARADNGRMLAANESYALKMNIIVGQRMREGQPSLKGFCDLGLKLESCVATHQQDDVDRFLHPKAISQLVKVIFY